jgi:hypothetical protein
MSSSFWWNSEDFNGNILRNGTVQNVSALSYSLRISYGIRRCVACQLPVSTLHPSYSQKSVDVVVFGLLLQVSAASFYLDSGDTGPGHDDESETIRVRGSLELLGKQIGSNLFYYLDEGGSHNERSWGARVWRPFAALYPVLPIIPTAQ